MLSKLRALIRIMPTDSAFHVPPDYVLQHIFLTPMKIYYLLVKSTQIHAVCLNHLFKAINIYGVCALAKQTIIILNVIFTKL